MCHIHTYQIYLYINMEYGILNILLSAHKHHIIYINVCQRFIKFYDNLLMMLAFFFICNAFTAMMVSLQIYFHRRKSNLMDLLLLLLMPLLFVHCASCTLASFFPGKNFITMMMVTPTPTTTTTNDNDNGNNNNNDDDGDGDRGDWFIPWFVCSRADSTGTCVCYCC